MRTKLRSGEFAGRSKVGIEARSFRNIHQPFGAFVRIDLDRYDFVFFLPLFFAIGRDALNFNRNLAYTISAILSGYSGAACAAAADTDTAGVSGIDEIVVTAQRRNESIQNVPITIQAITGEQLKQLNVSTFDDVIKYLPNVTFGANGPGQGNIFMRGLSAGVQGNQSSAT